MIIRQNIAVNVWTALRTVNVYVFQGTSGKQIFGVSELGEFPTIGPVELPIIVLPWGARAPSFKRACERLTHRIHGY